MVSTTDPHPLSQLFQRIALGELPQPDGLVEVLGAPPGPVDAVVAFTGHHLVAADVTSEWVRRRLPPGDLSAPVSAAFLAAMGDRIGSEPGSLDIVLCALAESGVPELDLIQRSAGDSAHPRVERARRYRTDVRVYATPDSLGGLVVGRGLAGRWEASLEVEESSRSRGLGRAIVMAARRLVQPGEPLFMQVAPGNAASLRSILAGGFRPVGGEVLFVRRANTS